MNWTEEGPIVVWVDHGVEGWHPRSYATLKEALLDSHDTAFIVTRRLDFDVVEKC